MMTLDDKMDDTKVPGHKINYYCKKCDYNTSRKSQYGRHQNTKKHLLMTVDDKKVPKVPANIFYCNCGKMFKFRQGLWKHKQKCKLNIDGLHLIDNNLNAIDKDILLEILKQNQTIILENQEFKKMLVDLATKPTNITNNTNLNKQFNLQIFLHEKCKNAMNINDFVSSLEIISDDLENIGKNGYIQGFSNIFIKGLKELDETLRPLHCTDKKRETLYIKDTNGWDKDESKDKIKNVIKEIAHKNFKYIPQWTDENPNAIDINSNKNMEYMNIINQVMTGISPDNDNGINKIIKNVANEVYIDK